jgi:DNA-binding response OmpR family regulator
LTKKAYIIDDEEAIRILLSALLKREGIETESHSQIEGAVERARQFQADVIFLDLSLKDGSGFSIIPNLRKVNPQAEIVIISAHTDESEMKHARDLSVNYFLPKPLNRELILNTLENIF